MDINSQDTIINIEEISGILSKYFTVKDYYLSDLDVVFHVYPIENLKRDFINIYNEFKGRGYLPFIETREEDTYIIRVRKHIQQFRKRPVFKPLILFLITLGTVFVDGYIRSENPILYNLVPNYNPLITTLLFTASLLGIIGIHEIGHEIALYIHKIRASWPYFIPGIPGIFPTFGAMITQEEIPPNRDRLFDLGIAGPIAGLLTTLIVTVYAVLNVPIITIKELERLQAAVGGQAIPFPVPILYILIQEFIRPVPEGYVILVDPLTWAAIVGMLITALNIFPAWQLDGGHLARAVLGPKYHGYSTLISIFILFAVGYYFMALLIFFMYMLSGGLTVRPLDDISPVSGTRKILFVISWLLALVCLPFPQL